jgi:hypothetical protein
MHQFWITLTQTKAKTQDGNSPKMLCNVNVNQANQAKPSQATWLRNFFPLYLPLGVWTTVMGP